MGFAHQPAWFERMWEWRRGVSRQGRGRDWVGEVGWGMGDEMVKFLGSWDIGYRGENSSQLLSRCNGR